jgi:signal transduction histidine kinase
MIENAVNYNKDNGAVEIATAIKNNKVNISIKDTGLGIKKEDLERIFERFYRTDASRSMEGTGLGLSIAKAIIEAHGGMIKAESDFGRGSCFTIILPLSSDTEQE